MDVDLLELGGESYLLWCQVVVLTIGAEDARPEIGIWRVREDHRVAGMAAPRGVMAEAPATRARLELPLHGPQMRHAVARPLWMRAQVVGELARDGVAVLDLDAVRAAVAVELPFVIHRRTDDGIQRLLALRARERARIEPVIA